MECAEAPSTDRLRTFPVFHPVNPSILKILIQTIIMNTPQLDPVFPFSRLHASLRYHITSPTDCQEWIRDPQNSKELLDCINPIVV